MAFQANNVQVEDKKVASPSGGATPTVTQTKTSQKTKMPLPMVLSEVETRILLEALKTSTFKGEMVEVVYTLAVKLKSNLDNV
mgnify:CR=1 FL=1